MTIGIDIMERYLGFKEDNLRHRAALRLFFKKHRIDCDPFTTPWCAAMVNACERAVGKKGTGLLNARSFLNYGSKIELGWARPGDIVIFTRGGSSWQGHVAYFVSRSDERTINVIGGNQSNQVCYQKYPIRRILGIRRR